MDLILTIILSALALLAAYRWYGALLARLFKLDDRRVTPAHELRDDLDYAPTRRRFLMGQHFSAIAAAGPVVGPILAGVMFGWLPALIWIIVGSIFVGGVHDMGSLVASIRHKARSIAEIVRQHMSQRSYILFLLFVWIALVYIIVAFTDVVALSFVGGQTLEDGTVVKGGGIATSSMLYLALPVVMGLLLKTGKVSLLPATVIFLPLVGVAIAVGQKMPLDLEGWLGWTSFETSRLWAVILLAYCFVAGLVPLWLLLQPRGHLGGWFLYAALVCGMLSAVFVGGSIEYPAFTGWVVDGTGGATNPLFPILFITIACGACSGFHCLIASGTTSKQLRVETDAKAIGYGTMLLEGMVAVISLACVMMITREQAAGKTPQFIYAAGIGRILDVAGIPVEIAISFGLLAFTTFVYDTLDVCTRLGRFIIQELTGWSGAAGRVIGTAATVLVPTYFLINTPLDANGVPQPAWRIFWALFGASNQLLAALALIGITVWLWRTYRAKWVWFVVGIPTVFMYTMSSWALLRFIRDGFATFAESRAMSDLPTGPVPWVALVLVGLAALLLVEAMVVFLGPRRPPESLEPAPT
jgi:carbon starvation protein